MYIILKRHNGGQLTGSTLRQVGHDSKPTAEAELRRLVKQNPGTEFYLFQSMGSMKAEIQLDIKTTGCLTGEMK